MGACCCSIAKTDERPLKEIKQSKDRGCTDILFLLLFLAFWGLTFGTLINIRNEGDVSRIIRGADMDGKICGIDLPDLPLAAWPSYTDYNSKICVASCDETLGDRFVDKGPSKELLYYCVPNVVESVVSVKFSSEMGARAVGDIWTAGPAILGSAAVALVLSLAYTWFCKRCAGCLVWTCILLTIAGGITLSYVLLTTANTYPAQDDRKTPLRVMGWVCVGVTTIFTLAIFFMRGRIQLAVGVVQEAAKVLEDVFFLLLFPLIPMAMAVLYLAFWLYAAVFVYSVGGDIVEDTPQRLVDHGYEPTMIVHHFDTNYRNALVAHFFGLLWNAQFIFYFGYMVLAATVADWYFSINAPSGGKKRGNDPGELSHTPLIESTCRTLRFHLGSIALGSLIIATIQFIRAVLLYIQKKTHDKSNQLTKCLLACVQCILKCLQCCIDKINKNAFIWISIWGDNFCEGACCSFALLWRNLIKVAAINMVGAYLCTLGKFTVSVMTTGVFALVFVHMERYNSELSSPIAPCVLVFFVSWLISSLCMLVFDTIIDTTFLCFLVDHEHNKGGNMMASEGLQRLVNEHSADSEKEAIKMQKMRQDMMGSTTVQGEQYQPL